MPNVSAARVHQQILNVLDAWGMDPEAARITADMMVETDLLGVDSHGVSMLGPYEEQLKLGQLRLTAKPGIVRDMGCTALMDGGAGLGHPVSVAAMNLAVDKALEFGVGVVGVRNSHHFGAAGVYSRIAAQRGVIGMVTSATRGINMVPTRGAVPVLGTNPISFAAPAARNRPFVLDMATTTVAANKIRVYDLKGKAMPEGWVVDGEGQSFTDPGVARAHMAKDPHGGLTPLGGTPETSSYKGYGLAMLVHILGGTLTGASFSPLRVKTGKPGDPQNLGHFFMAINQRAFRDEGAFEADLDAVIDVLHGTEPIDPAQPVLVAGDPEAAERERRLADGIPIADALDRQLRAICERAGAAYVLQDG